MIIKQYTRDGLKPINITSGEFREMVLVQARNMVRETGYHAVRMKAENAPMDESWSRSFSLYRDSCRWLRQIDPAAESFISVTYNPDRD